MRRMNERANEAGAVLRRALRALTEHAPERFGAAAAKWRSGDFVPGSEDLGPETTRHLEEIIRDRERASVAVEAAAQLLLLLAPVERLGELFESLADERAVWLQTVLEQAVELIPLRGELEALAPAVREVVSSWDDALVHVEACSFFGATGRPEGVEYLQDALAAHPDPLVRMYAAGALARRPDAWPRLEEALNDDSDRVRVVALGCLVEAGRRPWRELLPFLDSGDHIVVIQSCGELVSWTPEDAVGEVLRRLRAPCDADPPVSVRDSVEEAIGALEGRKEGVAR